MVHKLTKIAEWDAPEFIFRKKTNDWYWALGIILIIGIVIAVLDKNFLIGVFIVLAITLIYFLGQKQPGIVHFEISDQGVRFDTNFFPYHNIDSFWIEDQAEQWKLVFQVRKSITPILTVPIPEDINPSEVRDVLVHYLPEQEQQEPWAHRVSEQIGF